eukprot:CAMPEP_0115081446 /NCGR_PEP_ID=MMETSP0227-20121206/19275_1 /TAXON_ID=89957 /ORGANISM="Polarella glacialis, Strain CCMP 1383" /LENGTH=53 /DNA_ID=CAMNT_0002469275 /DNA_START=80 /DNA_END=238 /DNA_ORIENTATION=-
MAIGASAGCALRPPCFSRARATDLEKRGSATSSSSKSMTMLKSSVWTSCPLMV